MSILDPFSPDVIPLFLARTAVGPREPSLCLNVIFEVIVYCVNLQQEFIVREFFVMVDLVLLRKCDSFFVWGKIYDGSADFN